MIVPKLEKVNRMNDFMCMFGSHKKNCILSNYSFSQNV